MPAFHENTYFCATTLSPSPHMTDILLLALLLLLLVALIIVVRSLLSQKERAAKAEAEAQLLRDSQAQREAAHAATLQTAEERHAREKTELSEQYKQERETLAAQHKQERDALTEQFKQERETLVAQHKQDKTEQEQRHQEAIAQQQQRHDQETKAQMAQWEERLKTLSLQFDKLSHDHLTTQREALKQQNTETINQLLNPLKQSVEAFQKDFATRMTTQGQTNAVMQETLKALSLQTERVGEKAESLASALRGGNKTQGIWGEGVLSNILEASGLIEGRDYELQKALIGIDGKQYIPDVVVNYADGKTVIIDAKTSLTAYLDYMEANSDDEREQQAKAHVASVRTHVKELAAKAYPDKLKNSLGYVLMFIPNEGSYILAVNADTKLVGEAFQQHVILVNPTNLLLSLKLIYLFGQSERQTKHVADIIEAARKLYDKFANFSTSFVDIGNRITKLAEAYTTANNQLREGRGNFATQLEHLKEKGVNPNGQIHQKLLEGE